MTGHDGCPWRAPFQACAQGSPRRCRPERPTRGWGNCRTWRTYCWPSKTSRCYTITNSFQRTEYTAIRNRRRCCASRRPPAGCPIARAIRAPAAVVRWTRSPARDWTEVKVRCREPAWPRPPPASPARIDGGTVAYQSCGAMVGTAGHQFGYDGADGNVVGVDIRPHYRKDRRMLQLLHLRLTLAQRRDCPALHRRPIITEE